MAKTKIKEDQYSLYVRTGGYIFRPYRSDVGDLSTIDNGLTLFKKEQEVDAKHVACTNVGVVKDKINKERWECHGTYIKCISGKSINLKSDDLWGPYKRPANTIGQPNILTLLGGNIRQVKGRW